MLPNGTEQRERDGAYSILLFYVGQEPYSKVRFPGRELSKMISRQARLRRAFEPLAVYAFPPPACCTPSSLWCARILGLRHLTIGARLRRGEAEKGPC